MIGEHSRGAPCVPRVARSTLMLCVRVFAKMWKETYTCKRPTRVIYKNIPEFPQIKYVQRLQTFNYAVYIKYKIEF